MSSIRKRFEAVKRVLNEGPTECEIGDLQAYCIHPIQYILDISRGQDVDFRCCVEDYTSPNGARMRACDSYDLPLSEFKKNCAECAAEIEKELPVLIKKYERKASDYL